MMKMNKKPYLNFWAFLKMKFSLRNHNNTLIAATLITLTRGLMNLP